MAVGDLDASFDVIEPYRPYPGYNHHYTQVSFKARILGEGGDVYLPNNEVFVFSMQGNRDYTWPPDFAFAPQETGTVTSTGTGPARLTDSSKSWGTDTLIGRFVIITSGAGINQCLRVTSNTNTELFFSADTWTVLPSAGNTYQITQEYGGNFGTVRASHSDLRPSRFLGHDEYTFWVMAFDQYGTPKVKRLYFNINEYLASRPGVANSISPYVKARSQNLFGDNTVTIKAKQGDLVKVYNKIQMDDTALNVLYPQLAGTAFNQGGVWYHTIYSLGFRSAPIASGTVEASNGEKTITFQNDTATYGSSNRKYVVSTQTPGFGESFATAHWKIYFGGGTADECRQIRTIWTPTTQTSIDNSVTGKPQGTLCKFYTIECKQISQVDGSESTPTQSDFYYNTSNNGDAFNVPISTGVWFEVNKNTTILIVDINSNGSDNAYWSQNVEVAGQAVATKTAYTSLSDAVTRGPNTLLLKDSFTFYYTSIEHGGQVFLTGNDNSNDMSKIADGYYFLPVHNRAIQTIGGEIIAYQPVGGSAVY